MGKIILDVCIIKTVSGYAVEYGDEDETMPEDEQDEQETDEQMQESLTDEENLIDDDADDTDDSETDYIVEMTVTTVRLMMIDVPDDVIKDIERQAGVQQDDDLKQDSQN